MSASSSLAPLLKPRSIAIIGASDNPKRVGGIPVDLLKRAGFAEIYPVNPKNAEVQGLTAYPDIEAVPGVPDLVLLALGFEQVVPTLERCHAKGIPAAIVFAAGYAETNEANGQARQAELVAFARRTGMRVAGPNCMGNANLADGIFTTFGTSFQPGDPVGRTALLTQSGNMCATLYRMGGKAGVGFNHVINTGNEADVDFADYLAFLADDEATDAAMCYIEELRDGPGFLAAARAFRAKGKLLAVYKVGASEKGAEAARSHTAALAGDSAAYDAAFRAGGVVRASELSQLADLGYLNRFGSRIRGASCAILSVSGAGGAILSDALSLAGAEVPTLPDAVQKELRSRIPDFGMVANPVDLTGNLVNDNSFLFDAIGLVLQPADIDVVMVFLPGYFLERAIDQLERAAAATDKLIVAIDTYDMGDSARLAAAGVAYFPDFDRAARAVAAFGLWRQAKQASATAATAAASWPEFAAERTALSETEGKDALAAFGVPVVHDALVNSVDEARKAAEAVGFPLVAKLVSPDVAHKTEHGLIRLSIQDTDAAVDAFKSMMAKAQSMNVQIDGVTFEPMLSGGVEILAGVTRDPVFGWMLTVGLGGVWTELMKDACHALLPVDAAGAEAMLRSLKGFKLLDGYRGAPKADVAAAAKAIACLTDAVLAGGERLREVEINPLLVMPEGRGAVAVDALVLLNTAQQQELEMAQ